MGGSQSKFPRNSWNFVHRDDRYEIYQNQRGQLAEKHLIENNPKLDDEEQLESYYYRYNTQKPLVKIYEAEFEESDGMCANSKNIKIMSQYIPFRLSDTRNLTHEQALYVLSESLTGYYDLYQRLGAFHIDQNMIGFNKDGKVKVWHNPNFAKNHFNYDNIVLMSTENPHNFDQRMLSRQEEEMVEDIWEAVDTHSIINPDFRSRANGFTDFGFVAAKDLVDQEIMNKNVRSSLRFEDRGGVLERSTILMSNSRHSNRNSTLQGRRY